MHAHRTVNPMRMNLIEWQALLNGWVADRTLLRADIQVSPLAASVLVRSVAIAPMLRLVSDDERADVWVELNDSYAFDYSDSSNTSRLGETTGRRVAITLADSDAARLTAGRIVLTEVTEGARLDGVRSR
jgi:hypothetical protein